MINANKFVLLAQSENKNNGVRIVEIEYEPMLAFVNSLYTCQVAYKVLNVADKYNVEKLGSVCSQYISANLTNGNVLMSIVEAEKLKAAKLITGCL